MIHPVGWGEFFPPNLGFLLVMEQSVEILKSYTRAAFYKSKRTLLGFVFFFK